MIARIPTNILLVAVLIILIIYVIYALAMGLLKEMQKTKSQDRLSSWAILVMTIILGLIGWIAFFLVRWFL